MEIPFTIHAGEADGASSIWTAYPSVQNALDMDCHDPDLMGLP